MAVSIKETDDEDVAFYFKSKWPESNAVYGNNQKLQLCKKEKIILKIGKFIK